MASTVAIDLAEVSQSLGMAVSRVQSVVDLLDAGNTIPFVTRYRKDQTGGMDEEQIRQIQLRVVRLRLLAERKQTILRSIESQGKLTPELAAALEAADTTKRLEDLYLPFKPKKQTLATAARGRGLEPLAEEILRADPACRDLDARARDFVNSERKVLTAADALLGAGHILAEMFSERADLRGKLRSILEQTGKLVSTATELESKSRDAPKESAAGEPAATSADEAAGTPETAVEADPPAPAAAAPTGGEASPNAASQPDAAPLDHHLAELATLLSETMPPPPPADPDFQPASLHDPALAALTIEAGRAATVVSTNGFAFAATSPPAVAVPATTVAKREKRKKTKKKENAEHKAFRDYFNYREALSKIPPHRILAINRGERAKALRVRVDVDGEAMNRALDELLVPEGHPHAEFLRGCARDALARLIFPSLEREVRRELTDRAEAHAVQVFARNLRNLLLQPPVRDRRVLAVDPGFKSGCKLVALDEFGNLLGHGVAHLVGRPERRQEADHRAVEMVQLYRLSVIAVGNGTGCREAERWVSDLLAGPLAEQGVSYVIVNEAGASVYSTSRLGREELPQYDATLRGAISIGRRLQDPLSELVKIDPANIGVGMYQHDVKAKHLRESLDAVVASCVNYVGVDVNSASPALLKYVSGLNQLTAQRLFDYRTAYGPFKSREDLKNIQGFGEATFVQAAGFLKMVGGTNPLDATWIHPESYDAARRMLTRLDAHPEDLTDKERAAQVAARAAQLQLDALAAELGVGVLTAADMVSQLARPGRDPRESLPQPIFKRGILKLDDLTAGMELDGTVLNVVDFGAFVEIGLKDSGLVHISQLANKYVQDPHELVAVGDIVHVWILDIDKERRRVSLTMIKPGTRRQPEPRQAAPAAAGRKPAERAAPVRPPRPAERQATRTDQKPQGKKPKFRPPPPDKPKPKPRPVVPLTEEMKKGKEPLRTFGDLMQFWAMKHEQPGGEEKASGS